eukprot:13226991-Alexandrium_andersonii.AAC.1
MERWATQIECELALCEEARWTPRHICIGQCPGQGAQSKTAHRQGLDTTASLLGPCLQAFLRFSTNT